MSCQTAPVVQKFKKVQKCVVVSLLGWDVEIYSSPVAVEKFINQRGIWWFVQAYGRMRLAPFSWRPLWGGSGHS